MDSGAAEQWLGRMVVNLNRYILVMACLGSGLDASALRRIFLGRSIGAAKLVSPVHCSSTSTIRWQLMAAGSPEMGQGIEAGLGQGGACGPRVAPRVPDVGLGLGQGGGRVAPSVPGTVKDFGLGVGTGGDCGSTFWVSLSLLRLQLLCELSLPLLPLLSLWLSLLSDEELCASNSKALGSYITGWAPKLADWHHSSGWQALACIRRGIIATRSLDHGRARLLFLVSSVFTGAEGAKTA